MSYAERSLAWFFRNRVIRGFSILADSKFIFYSLITLIWLIFAPISLVFHNFLGEFFVKSVLKLEMAIILSFFLSGLIINFISSIKIRISLTTVFLVITSIVFFLVIPEEVQYYFPVFGSIVFAGIFGLSYFIIIRSFNTSWVGRIMMVGKSPNKIFMHKIAIFINGVSIVAPIFLLIRYFLGYIISDLILAMLGFAAWGVIMYATTHFSGYFSYDIFASILSATNLIVFIFFFLYIGEPILVIVFDIILILFGISALVQFFHSRRKVERVSVYTPKSTRAPEDSSIVIIQDEDDEADSTKIPIYDESKYDMEQEMTEVRSHADGLIVILLGLILSFHFILLQFLGDILIGSGFILLPFQFTLIEYHLILLLLGYCFLLSIYIAFKFSLRFRGYTTKTMSEEAAFMKFLTLIDEDERKRLLRRVSKTVRDILVGGLMDFIEGERRPWKEGLRKGRKFLRRLFRGDKEE
ncbi:MAG: hypothetical protein HWN66_10380 [Candidatus Helarchaeota archaeon]|nr:hypothetical protein [Candidatus Helarchaeota archaeon]